MNESTQSAIIVPVPAAEPHVGRHRSRLDAAASWGIPAHVTVLYPFRAAGRITDGDLAALAAIAARIPVFTCEFREVRWFGDDVAWLAPEPDQPFRDLTRNAWAAFPDCPPYGGAFEDTIPHLTVAHDVATHGGALRAAADELSRELPIRATIDRVWLMTGTDVPDGWVVREEFPLAC